jgi:NDP-sugar pyrophosphorylase family protein
MIAGIIAAGEGSRLKLEGVTLPKPLVQIDGVPLVERLIQTFIRNGVTELAIIVNEYSLEVKEFIEKKHFPVPINFVVKSTPSSMHSLFELGPFLSHAPGHFLLSTVDSIFAEAEFLKFLQHAQSQEHYADGVLAVTSFIDDENPLYVEVDPRMRIRKFVKGRATSKWVTGGLYTFSPRIFGEMQPALDKGTRRLRNFLAHLLTQGAVLEAFPFSKIIDVDHVHDIRVAEEMLKSV